MDWPLIRIWIAIIGVTMHWKIVDGSISGWNKTPTQYHVQTDEGSERYFRFQTYNGQYRRERRLDDGTVVGSYGWVDPTGFLRMTDYIADSKGYRVVKEFMEFVGTNSIDDGPKYSASKQSLRVAKPLGIFETKKPAGYFPSPSTDAAVVVTTVKPKQLVAFSSTPRVPSGYYETPNNSVTIESPRRANSHRRVKFYPTPITPPQNALVPPRAPQRAIEIPLQKATPTISPKVANSYAYVPAMSNYARKPSSNSLFFKGASSAERQSESRTNNVTLTASPSPAPRLLSRRPVVIIRNHNTPEEVPESGEGKEDVFQAYTTPLRSGTGFIYKVPHQYHKEETEIDGSRSGSFGYVDPYGIRRVIHYNAGQAGFQHLRDFKFVGRQY